MPSVPADRPPPPALPQERGRSAGRLPVLGAAHHHRWGHLGHGADQGGDRQRERGVGTGWGSASFAETCGAWPLFSLPSSGPLLVSRCRTWRANSRVWGAKGVRLMKDPTDKLCTYLFITLGGPLPPDSYGSLVNPPLGLLPQTPARLGQVEEMGGPKRWRRGGLPAQGLWPQLALPPGPRKSCPT